MILIFSVNTNHESVAYRSFSPSKFEARGARKVTTGINHSPRRCRDKHRLVRCTLHYAWVQSRRGTRLAPGLPPAGGGGPACGQNTWMRGTLARPTVVNQGVTPPGESCQTHAKNPLDRDNPQPTWPHSPPRAGGVLGLGGSTLAKVLVGACAAPA